VEEEARRIPSLPGFLHPSGVRDIHTARTPEELLDSVDAVPPRPASPSQVREWTAQLGDLGLRTSARANAAFQLGITGAGAGAAVPALTAALGDPERAVRRAAAEALGRMGPAASSALPALRQALNDPSGDVRFQAERALRNIKKVRPPQK